MRSRLLGWLYIYQCVLSLSSAFVTRTFIVESRGSPDNFTCNAKRIRRDLRFPETKDGPPRFPQRVVVPSVASDVCLNLSNPIGGIVAEHQTPPTFCQIPTVPEISITEHHESLPDEHYVRLSG